MLFSQLRAVEGVSGGCATSASTSTPARSRGTACQPRHHLLLVQGRGAWGADDSIPDVLLYYRHSGDGDGDGGSVLRACMEGDRGARAVGEALTAMPACTVTCPRPVGRPRPRVIEAQPEGSWRRRYAPRHGPVSRHGCAPCTPAPRKSPGLRGLLRAVPVLTSPLVEVLPGVLLATASLPARSPPCDARLVRHRARRLRRRASRRGRRPDPSRRAYPSPSLLSFFFSSEGCGGVQRGMSACRPC